MAGVASVTAEPLLTCTSLTGDDIGFVPRELTGRFLTPPWFGRVRSCGPALESDPQMWGVQVD